MRLVAGMIMGSLIVALLLCGNDKSTFVLMTIIQAKVFHVRIAASI